MMDLPTRIEGLAGSGQSGLIARQCAAHRCENAISLLEAAFVRQPGDSDVSYQIGYCYSGACRSHSQVSLPLAIAYFERAIQLSRSRPQSVRAEYLDSLGNARMADQQGPMALAALEEAAVIYQNLGLHEEWARTEHNLGNACCELAGTGNPSMWAEAVRHYLLALRVRTEHADPVQFAATAQNLGTAYRQLPTGDHAENLRKAIGCYCAAFRAYRKAHCAEKCGDLHNNLGNSYLDLANPAQPSCKYVRRALRHYDLALQVRTKDDRPHDYAVTQFNRAQGYLALGVCDPAESAQLAAKCFREALDGFLECEDVAAAEMVIRQLKALKLLSSASTGQA